jgi:hypothetical protein
VARWYNRRAVIVPAVFAAVLIGLTVWSYVRYRAKYDEWSDWMTSRPVSGPVDLSRPGTLTVPFTLGDTPGHGLFFNLVVEHGETGPASLQGLEVSGRLTDTRGADVGAFLNGEPEHGSEGKTAQWREVGFCTRRLPPGEYTLTLEVRSGAPDLAAVPQGIYTRYWLCELEMLPVWGRALLTFVTGFPAAMLWLVVLVRVMWPGRANGEISPTDRPSSGK